MLYRYLPLLAVAAIAPLGAQSTCHHASGNTPTAGGCNVIPWGMKNTAARWVNQRYQAKMSAAELGNAKRIITGLSFAPCNAGTHSSTSLVIKMAHHKGTMTSNFVTNLGNSAVTVFNKKNHSWTMTANQWSKVGLTAFFSYDPAKGDLLVEITVMGNHSSSGSSACRSETTLIRNRLWGVAWVGTPPTTGNLTNSYALKMRVCTGTPKGSFVDYGNGCGRGPLTIVGSGAPNPGKKFGLHMINGRASSGGFVLLGAVKRNLSLASLGMPGCTLYLDPVFSSGVAFGPKGVSAILSFGVPNNPYFVGKRVYGQGANLNRGSNGFNLTVSQGTAITFGK